MICILFIRYTIPPESQYAGNENTAIFCPFSSSAAAKNRLWNEHGEQNVIFLHSGWK
jgi:hypothetical protein